MAWFIAGTIAVLFALGYFAAPLIAWTVAGIAFLWGLSMLASLSAAVSGTLTAIFVAVILTVASKRPSQAGIIIPLTLVAIHFVGMAASGASVNPIRSLAPAVVSGSYDGLWVYLTAPFLGSIVGWALYKLLNPADEALDDETEDGDMDDFDDEDDALEPA